MYNIINSVLLCLHCSVKQLFSEPMEIGVHSFKVNDGIFLCFSSAIPCE